MAKLRNLNMNNEALAGVNASEAAEMILRIDDMIAARNALNSSGPDESGNDASGMPPMGGMPGGMGGMPPMM